MLTNVVVKDKSVLEGYASYHVQIRMDVREANAVKIMFVLKYATLIPTVRLERFVLKVLAIQAADQITIVRLQKYVFLTNVDAEMDLNLDRRVAEIKMNVLGINLLVIKVQVVLICQDHSNVSVLRVFSEILIKEDVQPHMLVQRMQIVPTAYLVLPDLMELDAVQILVLKLKLAAVYVQNVVSLIIHPSVHVLQNILVTRTTRKSDVIL